MWKNVFVVVALCFICAPLCSARQEGQLYRTVYVRDITLQDGTKVPPNKKLEKVWEVVNKGTEPLKDVYLTRLGDHDDPNQIRSPQRKKQKNSKPGELWKVKIDITTPATAGKYRAKFKTAWESGELISPKMPPLYVEIEVVVP